MIINTLRIEQIERGLQFRHGDLERLIGPGVERRIPIWDILRGTRIVKVSVLDPVFERRHKEVLVKNAALREAMHVLDLSDTQRAFGWKDGRLAWILGPGLHAFWKEPFTLRFEVFDVGDELQVEHDRLDTVLGHKDASWFLGVIDVEPNHEVLVFRDGRLVARAKEGRLVHWKDSRKVRVFDIDLREQTTDVTGQEIMTHDKVTLRVNLAVTYQVVDPLEAVTVTSDFDRALYREAQLVLRAAIGTRTLDALLSDKEAVAGEVEAALTARVEAFGIHIRSVGLRDLILPGDMKVILNQVILAQKAAEANVIKRREETAAARSQANTARLLADNPILARMKELEVLQEILAGTKATFVFGQGEIAGQVRALVDRTVSDHSSD